MNQNEFDRLRRLIEQTQGPLEHVRKQQELLDQIVPEATAVAQLARQIQDQFPREQMRSMLEAAQTQSALNERFRAIIDRPGFFQMMDQEQKRVQELRRMMDTGLLPEHQRLAEVAARLADQIKPFPTMANIDTEWSERLRRQMESMTASWVDNQLRALSFQGFAVASRIGFSLRSAPAFDEETREELDEDLGGAIDVDDDSGPEDRDAAHIAAGMETSLFAIAPAGFGEVLIQTGFVLKREFVPVPQTTDGTDPGLMFHPGHNMLITVVEQNLRSVVNERMATEYGANWLRDRMHPDIVKEWTARREEAVSKGEASLDLIHYSNFMELKDIVVRKDHWRVLFKTVFKHKGHFEMSMERLHPIRNPLAHSRPIGRGQQIHLMSEAAHVLGALGIDIFRRDQ